MFSRPVSHGGTPRMQAEADGQQVTKGLSMKNVIKFTLAAAVSLVALEASAGGFGVREQSTTSQGASFAGAATSAAGLSGMYWNPALVTSLPGMNVEKHFAGIFGYSKLSPTTGSGVLTATRGDSGNLGIPAIVGANYFNYQLTDRVFLGMSINAPYGLKTKSEYNWAGQVYGRSSKALNMVATPTVGYIVNDWLAIGAGIQIGYFDVTLKGANPSSPLPSAAATAFSPNAPSNILQGDSWGVGYTLGATIKPVAGTEIGIGFRSSIHYGLEGSLTLPYASLPIKANVNTPETFTIGLRQQLGQNFTALAGFEWSNWSRIKRAAIRNASTDAYVSRLSFDYEDGWMASLGGEYRVNPNLLVRTGFGYEKSPVTDATRSIRIPDNDRIWASIGASYKWNDKLSFDAAYTHVFVKDPNVRINSLHHEYKGTAAADLVANGKSHVDIISFSMRYSFNPPPPPVSKSVITKG